MRHWLTRLILFFTTLSFAQGGPSFYDGIAAQVNDKVITLDTAMKELYNNFDFSRLPPAQQPQKIKELYPVILDLLIDRILILQAYEASGITIPDKIIAERIQTITAEEFGGNDALLKERLQRLRLTHPEWTQKVRENIILQAMRQTHVNEKIKISPRMVREYYAANKANYIPKAGTHLRTILIQGTPTQADNIWEALNAGESFERLAQQYSIDEKAANGGDWDTVSLEENFAPAVITLVQSMKPGDRQRLDMGSDFHLIVEKVAEHLGEAPALSTIWPLVERDLYNQKAEALYKTWTDSLRKNAYILINNPYL